MARLSKQQLFRVVEAGLFEGGWQFVRISDSADHPASYLVFKASTQHTVRVYIWNLTHGGGAVRPAHEYRIQVTGIDQFLVQPDTKTLILGWWDDVGVFAGFDVNYHRGALGQSPSIQVGEEALRTAVVSGFSPHHRGQNEIAFAFRPDFLGPYIDALEILHFCGELPQELQVLEQIGQEPEAIDDEAIEQAIAEERRFAVTTTRRAIRDNNFRARVLSAYGNKCSMCETQLKLVEGAHIIPAAHERSTDETSNGIALCVLHHRAYDRALVTFDEDYRTQINVARLEEYAAVNLDGGRAIFEGSIRPILRLPPDSRDHPRREYVAEGNRLRGW